MGELGAIFKLLKGCLECMMILKKKVKRFIHDIFFYTSGVV